MYKRAVALTLAFCMIIGLAGCNQTAPTSKEQTGKGRFVEKQISLPEGVGGRDVIQMDNKDDNLNIYAFKKDAGKITFNNYQYKEGQYKDVTPEWLKTVSFDEKDFTPYGGTKIVENMGGKSYLLYTLTQGENWISHLYCSEDGKTVQDVTPADWLEEDEEYHYYECPKDIVCLDDGSLIAFFNYKIKIYDTKTMTIKKEINLEKQYDEAIYADKDSYYLIAKDDNYGFAGIERFQVNSDTPVETITTSEDVKGSNFLDILEDGSLILTGQIGFLKKSAGSENWTQIVNGIYTFFAMQSVWCNGMTALSNDSYYALFLNDSDEGMLMEYTYDPEVASKPDKTLTVYSVYDNAAVNQAAAMYTKQNPDVLVNVETGISSGEEDTADINTVLQNLNTKLIAGEGADILVLDGLDTTVFTDKKLLADISDIMTPMVTDGTILSNIAKDYTNEDGSVYLMPMKISMNVLVGDTIDADKSVTLEALAEEVSKQSEPVFGPMTAADYADTFVPFMVTDLVNGKELNKEVLASKLESIKLIADNGGVKDEYKEDEWKWGIWDIAAFGGAAFSDIPGFLQAMFPMAFVKFINASFTSYENAYRPIGEIGINASCKDMDTAKDFMKYCFSFDIQDGDFYDGFAMNVKALENQTTKDRSGYQAVTEIEAEGGQYVEFIVGTIRPEDSDKLIKLCKQVNKKEVDDKKIKEVIAEVLPEYLKGSSSLEDTVSKVEKGLNMYLAE